jgi:hypothetical protein
MPKCRVVKETREDSVTGISALGTGIRQCPRPVFSTREVQQVQYVGVFSDRMHLPTT